MAHVIANAPKPEARDFVIPPLCDQTINRALCNPKWMRMHFLEFMCKRYKWQRGAELGVLVGRTISHVLAKCPLVYMIGVDAWESQPDNKGPEGWEHYNHDAHYLQTQRKCNPYVGRYELIKAYTHEAAKQVPDESLDFIFIDADHSYEGCKRDIIDWSPKLKRTGWLLGHDINWPGVRKAVDELVPGYEIGPNVVWFRPLNPVPCWQNRLK